jgi:hypothetical protein
MLHPDDKTQLLEVYSSLASKKEADKIIMSLGPERLHCSISIKIVSTGRTNYRQPAYAAAESCLL